MNEIWLNLENKPLEKTKTFVRSLFETELADKITWFDKRDSSLSFARQEDAEMTLDHYLSNLTDSVMVRYVVGRKEYLKNEQVPAISLLLRDCFKTNPTVSRFAWFFCPLHDQNYTKIDKIFREIYGIPMEECEKL